MIDTDYRALVRGGENNAGNTDVFVRSMYRLRDELQCHVLVVHTFGRNKAVDAHVRHLLRCAVDTELEVTRGVKTGVSTVTVNKQRDDRTGNQFEFELAQIELGRNRDGDPVTSCVIRRRVGRSMTKAKGSPVSSVQVKWSPVQQQVFNKLIEAITQAGEILPWNERIPAEIPCVHVKVWRKLAYTGPISSSPNLDTKRKAFQRASEALIEAGWVGKWGNLVWLVQ